VAPARYSAATFHAQLLLRASCALDARQCINAEFGVSYYRVHGAKPFRTLEAIMKNAVVQENKERWALFEQVSPTSSAVIWAIVAVIVVAGAWYLLQ
jgi:hypothetical protein